MTKDETLEQPKEQWHLDKRLNISHIVATITIVGGLFIWGSKLEERISLIERSNQLMEKRYDQDIAEIKATLIRIEERLSRR